MAAMEQIEDLVRRLTNLEQRIVQLLGGAALELRNNVGDAAGPTTARVHTGTGQGTLLDASAASAGRAEDEALVALIFAEARVDVVVQSNAAEQTRGQPHRQERLLTVAVPDSSTPWTSADSRDNRAEGLLNRRLVHGRLEGLVPIREILLQVSPLEVALVVDQLLVGARISDIASRAHRCDTHEGRRGNLLLRAAHRNWHSPTGDGLVEPIRCGDGSTAAAHGVTGQVVHVASCTKQNPRHRQHPSRRIVFVSTVGEEGKGKHFAIELDQRLVLAGREIAELRATTHNAPGDVRQRLLLCAAGHEVREAAIETAVGLTLAYRGLRQPGSQVVHPTIVLSLRRCCHEQRTLISRRQLPRQHGEKGQQRVEVGTLRRVCPTTQQSRREAIRAAVREAIAHEGVGDEEGELPLRDSHDLILAGRAEVDEGNVLATRAEWIAAQELHHKGRDVAKLNICALEHRR
mmetsp:Transcript_21951/g.71096  ORF Transcript_21951/g.71096 Transcript_21951/m.71096 type:complete len:462 (+) Transcript_21951:83-1468(+)